MAEKLSLRKIRFSYQVVNIGPFSKANMTFLWLVFARLKFIILILFEIRSCSCFRNDYFVKRSMHVLLFSSHTSMAHKLSSFSICQSVMNTKIPYAARC